MNLEQLFNIQWDLDQKIRDTHNLENQILTEQKILALQVELGELANETRCFKYWSTKAPSATDVILEEYVDGLHFVLSLGLDFHYNEAHEGLSSLLDEDTSSSSAGDKQAQTEAFARLFDHISAFSQDINEDHYAMLFQSYMDLAKALGFKFTQIEDAYLEKNKVNHERQAQGY
ncbi:dUTP diphosphatase [Caldalkalibacillus salinus]|uniref:dUTP diphosphatase n=1 Tax=Caldalkalibacillus salinus TaxID=2803787 RepID=UPI0019242562|nr:dUTP diphosphatase [Caldalkalibacillus salinus]